jgi:SAM-dependent methyltransferase
MAHTAAFDSLALDYDAGFTRSMLGRMLRDAVWQCLDRAFAPGDRVLELNCGTGEDAVHLAGRGVHVIATDAAPAMVQATRVKAAAAGHAGRVDARPVAIERLGELAEEFPGTLDGTFSNFGGLNCVADPAAVAPRLAAVLRPGAAAVLCLMGPLVPWEWAWFLARGDARSAFRRLGRGGVVWRGVTVRYPSIRATQRAFAPQFVARRVAALGVLVPPTYAEGWARRHPRLVARLDRWERRIAHWPGVPWLGDHYLLELERR